MLYHKINILLMCHNLFIFNLNPYILYLELLPTISKFIKDYGPVVHFNLSGRSYVFLTDPDDIKVCI